MEFDRDGDGMVSIEEAHNVLQRQLGFSVEQSVELVRRYDLNGDGRLNYEAVSYTHLTLPTIYSV